MTNAYTYDNEKVHENTHIETRINCVGDIEIVVTKKEDGNRVTFNIQDSNEMDDGVSTIRVIAGRFYVRVLSAFRGKVSTYE